MTSGRLIDRTSARRVAVRAGRRLPLTTKGTRRAGMPARRRRAAGPGRGAALQRVLDEAADPFTSTVKTTIRRRRVKLGDPPVIQTVRESGYRIGEP